MNPGLSTAATGSLPSARAKSKARSNVSGLVVTVRTTSSRSSSPGVGAGRGRQRGTVSTVPSAVVLRSTVLPGTTEGRLAPAIARGAERALEGWLGLAVNPEFMREGSSLRDFAQPPMTLVGAADEAAVSALGTLYASVEAPFVTTTRALGARDRS